MQESINYIQLMDCKIHRVIHGWYISRSQPHGLFYSQVDHNDSVYDFRVFIKLEAWHLIWTLLVINIIFANTVLRINVTSKQI